MHDKRKCAKCMYHAGKVGLSLGVYCNYAGITGKTCLHVENGKTTDRRGDGDCALFHKGVAVVEDNME